jgi:hypothetical protein
MARNVKLENELILLQNEVKKHRKTFLTKIISIKSGDVRLSAKKLDNLRYWCGVRSLACLIQIVDSTECEKRGRPSILSNSEATALTLVLLRRGSTFEELAAYASISSQSASDIVFSVLAKFERYLI